MNGLGIFKSVVGVVVGAGVSTIVKEVVHKNVDEPDSKVEKFLISAGTFGLSLLISDLTTDHLDTKIDIAASRINNWRSR